MNSLPYEDIDQGILLGKSNIAQNEKKNLFFLIHKL